MGSKLADQISMVAIGLVFSSLHFREKTPGQCKRRAIFAQNQYQD